MSKLSATQDENKKVHLVLKAGESAISSLKCQVSKLQAVGSLIRNQMLQEDFICKLQQGNQEKGMLLSKLHESQMSQQKVKGLPKELKNMNRHNGVVQKSRDTGQAQLVSDFCTTAPVTEGDQGVLHSVMSGGEPAGGKA